MTNRERLEQNNEKIDRLIEKLEQKVAGADWIEEQATKLGFADIPESDTTARKHFPNFKMPRCSGLTQSFMNNRVIETLEGLDCPVVLRANGCFQGSSIKSVGVINFPSLWDADNIFYNCDKLESIEELHIPNASRTTAMFYSSRNIKRIGLLELNGEAISNATTNCFYTATKMERLILADTVHISKSVPYFFYFFKLLDSESIDSIINALDDLIGKETQSITFTAEQVAKMTQAQKDLIAKKNWTLVY